MKSLGHTLIQYDWYPYKKRRLGHRNTADYCKDIDSHLQAKEKCPQKKQTLPTPWSRTSSCQNCEEINIYCLSHPVSGIFVMAAQPNIHQKLVLKWHACEWLEKEMKILKKTSILLVSSANSQDTSAAERMILTLCNFYYPGTILTLLCE